MPLMVIRTVRQHKYLLTIVAIAVLAYLLRDRLMRVALLALVLASLAALGINISSGSPSSSSPSSTSSSSSFSSSSASSATSGPLPTSNAAHHLQPSRLPPPSPAEIFSRLDLLAGHLTANSLADTTVVLNSVIDQANLVRAAAPHIQDPPHRCVAEAMPTGQSWTAIKRTVAGITRTVDALVGVVARGAQRIYLDPLAEEAADNASGEQVKTNKRGAANILSGLETLRTDWASLKSSIILWKTRAGAAIRNKSVKNAAAVKHDDASPSTSRQTTSFFICWRDTWYFYLGGGKDAARQEKQIQETIFRYETARGLQEARDQVEEEKAHQCTALLSGYEQQLSIFRGLVAEDETEVASLVLQLEDYLATLADQEREACHGLGDLKLRNEGVYMPVGHLHQKEEAKDKEQQRISGVKDGLAMWTGACDALGARLANTQSNKIQLLDEQAKNMALGPTKRLIDEIQDEKRVVEAWCYDALGATVPRHDDSDIDAIVGALMDDWLAATSKGANNGSISIMTLAVGVVMVAVAIWYSYLVICSGRRLSFRKVRRAGLNTRPRATI